MTIAATSYNMYKYLLLHLVVQRLIKCQIEMFLDFEVVATLYSGTFPNAYCSCYYVQGLHNMQIFLAALLLLVN